MFTVFQGVAAESFHDSFKFCHQDLHSFRTWRPSINAVQLGGFAGKGCIIPDLGVGYLL